MLGFYAHLLFSLALYFQKLPPYALNNIYIYFYQQTLFTCAGLVRETIYKFRSILTPYSGEADPHSGDSDPQRG